MRKMHEKGEAGRTMLPKNENVLIGFTQLLAFS